MNPAGAINQAPSASFVAGGVGGTQATQSSDYKIIRRNGSVVAFKPSKIAIAVTKAFLAVNGGQGAASARIREQVEQRTHLLYALYCVAVLMAALSISKIFKIKLNWL
jgi:ribonucleoside-diphosphate reductase alpha chain